MTQRVFLHPGPLKTGTTYLQSLCYANRAALRQQGVWVVGDQRAHYRAANELMRRRSLRTTAVPEGAWARICAAALRAQGDVVMSCERYSLFGAEHVHRVLEDLAGREVHAVLTLRDLAAVLPARWQEGIKNGGTATWAEFQERVTGEPARLRKMTRAMSTLDTWAEALPPSRIHVVTVPPSGASRTLLFERFCAVLGIDPAALDTMEPTRANPSMGLLATELIRRVNAQDVTRLSGEAQHFEVKTFLARALADQDRTRPQLTPETFEAARAESEALVRRIADGGFEVVGDLADLTSHPAPDGTRTGVHVDRDRLLDAAAVAIAALADRSGARGSRLRRKETRGRRPSPPRRAWRRLRRRVSRPAAAERRGGPRSRAAARPRRS